MLIRIEGSDLPGRRAGAEADLLRLRNVHVGMQRKAEVVDLVPADAREAAWQSSRSPRPLDRGVSALVGLRHVADH
ncbi:DUF5990 family protein [Micromonospora chersina]|uniref:DUF5990 family protein n=1 Tax=Micromonospora chersina TaxID=47854 RepID=UPI0037131CA4